MNQYLEPLGGGVLVGAAAACLWLCLGRIAGISGIIRELFTARRDERNWRVSFLLGLISGGVVLGQFMPHAFGATSLTYNALMLAGLLVGVGTALANGCTSGHGVCGIARASRRSLAATATFMVTAALVTFVVEHLLKGAS